jgi:hypothetical protein
LLDTSIREFKEESGEMFLETLKVENRKVMWNLSSKGGYFIGEVPHIILTTDFINGEKINLCWVEFNEFLDNIFQNKPLFGYSDANDYFLEAKNGKVYQNLKIFFLLKSTFKSKKNLFVILILFFITQFFIFK